MKYIKKSTILVNVFFILLVSYEYGNHERFRAIEGRSYHSTAIDAEPAKKVHNEDFRCDVSQQLYYMKGSPASRRVGYERCN